MFPKLPGWLMPLTIISIAVAAVPPAIILDARNTNSKNPRINLIPDMDYQPRYGPQSANAMFADGRAMRYAPEGTIARGDHWEGGHLSEGRVRDDWAVTFPISITNEVMVRGQERFEVYCSPCHGLDGAGEGMIHRRGQELSELGKATWIAPTSIHDETVRERAVGHLFNTVTYGIRNMPAYGSQMSVEDRWAVVAYIRALQRSTSATIADVPREARSALEQSREES